MSYFKKLIKRHKDGNVQKLFKLMEPSDLTIHSLFLAIQQLIADQILRDETDFDLYVCPDNIGIAFALLPPPQWKNIHIDIELPRDDWYVSTYKSEYEQPMKLKIIYSEGL